MLKVKRNKNNIVLEIRLSSDLRPLLSSAIRFHMNVDKTSRDPSIGQTSHRLESQIEMLVLFSLIGGRFDDGGTGSSTNDDASSFGDSEFAETLSSSSSRFRNIGNCMRHASHGVYQDVRNRPLRINKRGWERRAFRGTFNLRQDRGWVNDGLKTTKRRLEDDNDEGSLVPWYQLSREKTGERRMARGEVTRTRETSTE